MLEFFFNCSSSIHVFGIDTMNVEPPVTCNRRICLMSLIPFNMIQFGFCRYTVVAYNLYRSKAYSYTM